MSRLSDYTAATTLAGSETFPVVTSPGGGSTGTKKISATDLAAQLASIGAYAADSDITSLDGRVDYLEAGGVFLQDATLATPIVSNVAFTDIASSGTIAANTLSAGDTVTCEFIGDMLVNNASNSTVKFQWLIAALTISTTPAAGWSIAFGANRRPIHAWMTATFYDATHFHWACGIEVASPKAAATEMGPFNGTTTGRDAVAQFTGTGVDIASAMTFKLQGQHSVNGAATDMRRLRQTWSVVKV